MPTSVTSTDHIVWLSNLYPEVRKRLLDSLPEFWPELNDTSSGHIFGHDGVSPEVIIPLAACKAVGGDPRQATGVAAALMAVLAGARILDDLQDRDNPHALWAKTGPERAFNYALGCQTLGYRILGSVSLPSGNEKRIYDTFVEGALVALKGQDRDLEGRNTNWEDYWKTTEMKTAWITATGAAMGAMAGTSSDQLVSACKTYGYHWGMALQVMNDHDGTWDPEGTSDLHRGKITLPVIYGLNCEHPQREKLRTIIRENRLAREAGLVKEILDRIDTKSYLIWTALKERDKALAALKPCPDEEGKKVLTKYLTAMFGDIGHLLEKDRQEYP